MKYSGLAYRYASAIFEIAKEKNVTTDYLKVISQVDKILSTDKDLSAFLHSPLVRSEDREKSLKFALKEGQVPSDIFNFLLLLAKKNRLNLLSEVVVAYQAKEDADKNMTRGTVNCATELTDHQKQEIKTRIMKTLNKNVELNFIVNPNLIGGLTAQIGSLRMDDAISSHLYKIKDDLTRRIN